MTPATFSSSKPTRQKRTSTDRRAAVPPLSRLTDDKLSFLYYFDVFARRNNFTGKKNSLVGQVKQLSGLHSCSYLMDAMLSLGAIQAVKLDAPDTPHQTECLATALECYSNSIIGLRDTINGMITKMGDDGRHDTVLWTTLFLGLFEVTRHYGHGVQLTSSVTMRTISWHMTL